MSSLEPNCLLLAIEEPKTYDIATFLAAKGFHLTQGIGQSDVLSWLKAHPVELLIVDVQLLGSQSRSVIKAIQEWNDKFPIIMLRSHKHDDGALYRGLTNLVDVLYKPALNLDQLYHCVQRALSTKALALENIEYSIQLEKANRELKEYVRVLERDQQAGRRIQSKLLPTAPVSHGGLNIDYKIIPSLYLSGDFIDYGYLSDRYFAFYLCDVSGHGAAPAFVTVWLKQVVRRYFYNEALFSNEKSFEEDTANLLARLNEQFMRTSLGSHITTFVGVIDTHTFEMRYVVAGHLPLPILCVDGQAQYLEGKGKPVGIFENTTWSIQKMSLPKDKPFSLTVFSDGVLEVLPPDNLIDKEDYLLNLMSSNPKDVSLICEQFHLSDTELAPDDIAVLRISSEMLS